MGQPNASRAPLLAAPYHGQYGQRHHVGSTAGNPAHVSLQQHDLPEKSLGHDSKRCVAVGTSISTKIGLRIWSISGDKSQPKGRTPCRRIAFACRTHALPCWSKSAQKQGIKNSTGSNRCTAAKAASADTPPEQDDPFIEHAS